MAESQMWPCCSVARSAVLKLNRPFLFSQIYVMTRPPCVCSGFAVCVNRFLFFFGFSNDYLFISPDSDTIPSSLNWTKETAGRQRGKKKQFYLEIFNTWIRYSSRCATHSIANSFVNPFKLSTKKKQIEVVDRDAVTHIIAYAAVFSDFKLAKKKKERYKLNQVNWTRLGIRRLITFTNEIEWGGVCAYVLGSYVSYLHTSQHSRFLSFVFSPYFCHLFTFTYVYTLLFAQEFYVYYSNGAGIGDRTYIGTIFAYFIHYLAFSSDTTCFKLRSR